MHKIVDIKIILYSNNYFIVNEVIMILRITNISTLTSGHPFRGKIPEKSGGGVRVVQMKDVSPENGICWNALVETELTGKKQPDWLIKGDVLFAARGSRNYAVLIDKNEEQVVASPHFYILRVKAQILLPEFLVWQLNQKPSQNYFDSAAEGSLTKSVRRSILEKTEITVPSIEKQKQILGLHETLLRERRLYAELINNAEKLMQVIASDLMSGKTI